MQILIQWICDKACDSAFFISSHETPMLLVYRILSNTDLRECLQYLYFLLKLLKTTHPTVLTCIYPVISLKSFVEGGEIEIIWIMLTISFLRTVALQKLHIIQSRLNIWLWRGFSWWYKAILLESIFKDWFTVFKKARKYTASPVKALHDLATTILTSNRPL